MYTYTKEKEANVDLNPMDLMNQMAHAEEKFCDKLDAEGPVTILNHTFARSWIMRVMAEDDYAEALDAYMRSVGIDVDAA